MKTLISFVFIGLISFLLFLKYNQAKPDPSNQVSKDLRVGAYFYSWFPENWVAGYAARDNPGYGPPLAGEYDSGDMDFFLEQVRLAKNYGIDFFILDWWPRRTDIRRRLKSILELPAENLKGFEFAIHYETLDLIDEASAYKSSEIVKFNDKTSSDFISHLRFIAKHYFNHPNYLRVDGKPLLILYSTRHIKGDFGKVLKEARRLIRTEFNEEVFIVGDEVFSHVFKSRSTQAKLRRKYLPDLERLKAFDAVTAYNPLNPTQTYQGQNHFVEQTLQLYSRYNQLTKELDLAFIPGLIPGYDDSALGRTPPNPVIPRSEGGKILLKRLVEEVGLKFSNEAPRLLFLTSWNEWNEGTNLEPSINSANTLQSLKSALRKN